jgi:hypothetical protein
MSWRHDLTQELEHCALDHLEVDLIVVAPAGHRPGDLLPGGASVIVSGVA